MAGRVQRLAIHSHLRTIKDDELQLVKSVSPWRNDGAEVGLNDTSLADLFVVPKWNCYLHG